MIGEEQRDDELVRWGLYGATEACLDHGAIEEATQCMARLMPLVAGVTDQEFQVRYAILTNRMRVLKEPTPSESIGEVLTQLAEQCQAAGWLELQWEVEHLLGTLYQKRGNFDAVKQHLQQAIAIINTLAAGLSEEYRDGFLKHRTRARVFAEFNAAQRNETYVSQQGTQISHATAAASTEGTQLSERRPAKGPAR